jgi:hypothetical protein
MIEKTWLEYKKRKESGIENKPTVSPLDLLKKNNYIDIKISNNRLLICQECPELLNITKQCKQCGCVMPLKVKLKNATCPLEKW